jgi:hypothetical protein
MKFIFLFAVFLLLNSCCKSSKFCINKTVDEVRSHVTILGQKIEQAKLEQVCKFVGYRKKAKEKVKCDVGFYPNSLGNMSWYPENVNQPMNYEKLKQKTENAYWLGFGPYIEWFGNFYLDFFVYDTFFHQNGEVLMNGTYLETGGADGIVSSNTLFFDRFLNWKGILIEPTICAKVQIPFNRPRSTSFHGGVCDVETNISISNMKDFCPDDEGYQGWDLPVRCSPLSSYMNEAKLGKTIDLMSIDIEGHYMTALKTIPFEDYNIRVIIVECTHGIHTCKEYLEGKGYNVLAVKSVVMNVDDDLIAWKNDC